MSEKKKKELSDRGRNFWCVVYPDSVTSDWLSKLTDLKVPCFVSPLHDKDLNSDNTPKKPHYHVMIMFSGNKSRSQIENIFDSFGGVYYRGEDLNNWIRDNVVGDIRGAARYLCHIDNPEKAKYDTNDVLSLCGADYLSVCSLSIDKYYTIQEMMAFCKENRIVAFSQLLDYSSMNHFDWFRSLCDNSAIVMREYMKSLSWVIKSVDGIEISDQVKEGDKNV